MAAAGTLNRPTSAQGSYGSFQTYYAPTSPTLPPGSFSRPSSAAGSYAAPAYAAHRTASLVRPVTHRHATSTQYIPTTTGIDAPTRIYGLRTSAQSSEDVRQASRQGGNLHRNYTAPDLRTVARKGPLRIPVRSHSNGESMAVEYDTIAAPILDNSRHSYTRKILPNEPSLKDKVSFSQEAPASPASRALQTQTNPSSLGSNHINNSGTNQRDSGALSPTDDEPRRQQIMQNTVVPPVAPTMTVTPASTTQEDIFIVNDSAANSEFPKAVESRRDLNLPTLSVQGTEKSIAGQSSDSHRITTQDVSRPSTGNSEAESQVSLREALTTERPRSQTPVPSNYTTPEKSKSLKDRLRRALSLSSGTSLNDRTMPPSQLGATSTTAGQDGRHIYAQNNKSTDNMSISSTASSASMMLRKMGHGLSKRTKRSFNGIFSGSSSKNKDRREDSQAQIAAPLPSTSSVSYVNAEPEFQHGPFPNRDANLGHGRMRSSISSIGIESPARRQSSPARTEITEAVSDVDGHGSVSFPRLSEEITVEDDRSRRASMHLERPLPIDLAEKISPARSDESSPASGRRRVSASAMSTVTGHVNTYTGRGILKKTFDPLAHRSVTDQVSPLESSNRADMTDFEISFAPAPSLMLDNFGANDTATAVTPSRRSSVPTSSANHSALSSPHTPAALKFSPRVTIHDTYTALEYDRRGEIATCNRLTPLLAQRIKEELNAYKMDEMDVAEESKRHTHFFS